MTHEAGEDSAAIKVCSIFTSVLPLLAEADFEKTEEDNTPESFRGGDDGVKWIFSAADSLIWCFLEDFSESSLELPFKS
jgi:hypothetical protein